ncbi:DUF4142 domain-containing protein [Streptomyces sp. V3I8]|uniref:DUF4142 domain-containing protein n=1 Tax=Streptomyces sp. V3I8 TaxID=3042279 RepID=UPI0027D83E8C|nr:DUF4142 domain-containing protein [Streptomyces sp. V3I8]
MTTSVMVVALSGISAPYAFAAEVGAQDEMFTLQAHQGNLTEIAAGHDAGKNATTECVRHIGSALVRDHSKLDADLKTLAGKLQVTLPGSPSAQQKKELAAVRAKAGGPAYDAAWLTAQDTAHRRTLALIDKELMSGKNPEVEAAARAARPVVAMHLDMVRGGTCHPAEDAGTVRAGDGGYLAASDADADATLAGDAPRDDSLAATGVLSMAGGLLAAGGAAWSWRTRRRSAQRR